ncbi:MAG: glycosyltransferase family 39 protein [Thermoflexales bacterium]
MEQPTAFSFARRHTLAILVTLHIALSVYTSLSVPLWESYDEPGHIFYARHIGQTGGLPPVGTRLSDYDESHQPPLYYFLPAIPFALIDTTDDLRPKYTASGRTWTVYQPEVEALPWRGTVLAIRLARLLSIIPGTLCVILTWRTARVLFPKQAMIAPVAAFVHAIWPMLVYMNGVVTNDTGMALMGSLVLWQIAELVRRPGKWRWWLGLAAAGAASVLTKDNGLTLLVAAIGGLGLVLARELLRKNTRAILMFLTAIAFVTGFVAASIPLSEGRTSRQFGAAISFLSKTTQSLAPAQSFGARPDNTPRDSSTINVISNVNWLDAWVSTIGQYSWGTLPPPESWRLIAASFAVTFALSVVVGLILGPQRWEILLMLGLIGAVVAAPVARGEPLFVGGRFFLPALGAICILLALTMSRWRMRVAGRAWSIAVVSGLSLFSLLAPVVVLRQAYQLPVFLDPTTIPTDIQIRTTLIFGDAIELLGYSQPKPNSNVGDTAQIKLFWRVLKPIARDHGVRFELFGIDGVSLEASWQQTPGSNNYPSSAWTAGATFADTIDIPIRPHASVPTTGVFKIAWFDQELNTILPATCVAMTPGGSSARVSCEPRVGMIRISSTHATPLDALAARFAAPPVASFGDRIGLTRFTLPESAKAGSVAQIALQWRASAAVTADYVSFVHVLDASGKLVAQQDNQPRKSTYPTSAWRASETINDALDVRLPQALAPGDYSVRLGWFEAVSGERLAVSADSLFSPQDGLVTLGVLHIIADQP